MADKSINIKFPFFPSKQGFFLETNKTTREAIKSDLIHLLLTKKGERLYLPQFGTNLYKFLFEPNDNITESSIKTEIENAIATYMPNLTLINFFTESDSDKTITVNIDYLISDGALQITDSAQIIFNI